jgi:hypothetical protein
VTRVQRRTFLLGLGGVALAGAVPGAFVLRGGDGQRAAATGSSSASSSRETAKVTKRDLAERADASGTLGFGESRSLTLGGHGTITALPALGAVIDRGGRLAEVDGLPVVLLLGDRPLWRALGDGVDDGPDVEQVEANLVALGHATEGELGPNARWTAATTAAVKRWQKALGVEQTGAIDPGSVVFQPAAVRVAEHLAEPGSPAGGPALKVTGTTQAVTVNLPARKQALVHVGDTVQVVLPSAATTAGTITSVGTVAVSGQGGQGDPTIPVTVVLSDSSAAAGLDQAPVTIKVTTTAAKGVLAVPVQALLALAEGGYAVEKVTGPTTTQLVGVTLGASADGWVEVRGQVAEGDEVVTAK